MAKKTRKSPTKHGSVHVRAHDRRKPKRHAKKTHAKKTHAKKTHAKKTHTKKTHAKRSTRSGRFVRG